MKKNKVKKNFCACLIKKPKLKETPRFEKFDCLILTTSNRVRQRSPKEFEQEISNIKDITFTLVNSSTSRQRVEARN